MATKADINRLEGKIDTMNERMSWTLAVGIDPACAGSFRARCDRPAPLIDIGNIMRRQHQLAKIMHVSFSPRR